MLAAIFVLALLASIVVVGRLMQQATVPSHQPQSHSVPTPHYLSFPAPANGTFCSGVRARHWATSPPTTAKMIDASTGWAYGPLRTTDGGSHWVDVSPPSIPNRTPINDQFFLDSTHAWVAETSGSSTACVDHVVTFRTADGGRTWQQAAPIPVRFADPTDYIWAAPSSGANWFSFIDAQNGWLLVGSGPAKVTQSGEWPGFGHSGEPETSTGRPMAGCTGPTRRRTLDRKPAVTVAAAAMFFHGDNRLDRLRLWTTGQSRRRGHMGQTGSADHATRLACLFRRAEAECCWESRGWR